METQDLERWKEPEPSKSFACPSLLDLVVDPALKPEGKPTLDRINEDDNTSAFIQATVSSTAFSLGDPPIQKEVVEAHPATTEDEQPQDVAPVIEVKEESQSEPQELLSESQEMSQSTNTAAAVTSVPPVPTRVIPAIPTPVATSSSQDVTVGTNSNVAGGPASDAPLASPNSTEEIDALENADSRFENRPEPMKPATLGSPGSDLIIIPLQPIQRCEPPTPTDGLLEVILSALSKDCNSQQLSQSSTITTDRTVSVHLIGDAGFKKSTQTLTHSESSFASRKGSVSSFTGSSRADSGSSYSTRSNTPEPIGYTDDFGVLKHENRGRSDKDRHGSQDNMRNQREFRYAESQPRSSSLPISR
jgi:hypothetical protein